LWIADPLVICRSLQSVWEGEEGRKTRIKKERKTSRKKKRKRKKRTLGDRYFVSVLQ
jgi:hypothetical protein